MSNFKEEYKKEAEKLKELLASEVELDLLRVFFKKYKFPKEEELLHIDFLKDYGAWITQDGNALQLSRSLRKLADTIDCVFKEN